MKTRAGFNNAIVYGLASLDPSKPIIITQEDNHE